MARRRDAASMSEQSASEAEDAKKVISRGHQNSKKARDATKCKTRIKQNQNESMTHKMHYSLSCSLNSKRKGRDTEDDDSVDQSRQRTAAGRCKTSSSSRRSGRRDRSQRWRRGRVKSLCLWWPGGVRIREEPLHTSGRQNEGQKWPKADGRARSNRLLVLAQTGGSSSDCEDAGKGLRPPATEPSPDCVAGNLSILFFLVWTASVLKQQKSANRAERQTSSGGARDLL